MDSTSHSVKSQNTGSEDEARVKSLEEREKKKSTKASNVASRCIELFGYGDSPAVRTRFYDRLQELAVQHGEPVMACIGTAAASAVVKASPGRYFCVVCKAELVRAGFDLPSDTLKF